MPTTEIQWWERFFTGLWVEVQRAAKDDELTKREVDFLEEMLHLPHGSEVLDAPCGVGRHSIELALRGYRVVGIDVAKPFLDEAETAASAQGVEVQWKQGDMRDLPWPDRFDAVACLWGSFGYFDDEGNRQYLRSAHCAIKPGGRFVMDTHTKETLVPRLRQPRVWSRVEDILVLEERTFDHMRSRTVTEWMLIREGEVFRETTDIRLYSCRELLDLLTEAGFRVDHIAGSLDGEPFGLGASRLYVAATKV